MLVEEHILYAIAAVTAFAATVVYFLFARRFEGATRRHLYVAPMATGILGVGYTGMAADTLVLFNPDGEPVYLTRYVYYCLAYPYLMFYLGIVADVPYRDRVLGAVGVTVFALGTMFTQWLHDPWSSLFALVTLASVGLLLWLLLRRLPASAGEVSNERKLMFSKVQYLFVFLFLGYLILSLFARQALGLFDAFVGIFVSAYIDLIGHIGLAGLLLYSHRAVEEIAANRPSPFGLLFDREK